MAGPIRISIISNGARARADLARTANATEKLGRSFSRVTKIAAGYVAVDRLVAATRKLVEVGGEYTGNLQQIQALTGASNSTLDKAAQSLEKNRTAYARYGMSVSDAASGVVELTKSGVSLSDSLKAVRGTMTLAKAGELSVADASELVSNSLNTFNLKAQDAGKVANYLANAANISSSDVTDLAEAFKYVAPVAAASGVDIQTVNAMLAELANKGIKASSAGTGLRNMFLSLQSPAGQGAQVLDDLGVKVFDADGKARKFESVLGDLRTALKDLPDEVQKADLRKLFGKTGVNSAQVLLDGGVDALNKYRKGVEKAGAANKLAASQSKGLTGTLDRIQALGTSTAQTLYRKYSPLVNKALKPTVKWLETNVDKIEPLAEAAADRLAPAVEAAADEFKLWAKAGKDLAGDLTNTLLPVVETAVNLFELVHDVVGLVPDPIRQTAIQVGLAAFAFNKLTPAVNAGTGAIASSAAGIRTWSAALWSAETRSTALGLAWLKVTPLLKTAAGAGGLLAVTDASNRTNKAVGALEGVAGGAAAGFAMGGPFGAAVGGAAGGLLGLFTSGNQAKDGVDAAAAAAERAREKYDTLRDSLNQVTGAMTEQARQEIYNDLQADGTLTAYKKLGVGAATVIDAVMGIPKASKQVEDALAKMGAQADRTDDRIAKLTEGIDSKGSRIEAIYSRLNTEVLSGDDRTALLQRIDAIRESIERSEGLIDTLKGENEQRRTLMGTVAEQTGNLRRSTREVRLQAAATQNWAKHWKDAGKVIPKKLETRLRMVGITDSVKGLAKVTRQAKLTPKELKTFIEVEGLATSAKAVQRYNDKLKATWKQQEQEAAERGKAAGKKNAEQTAAGIESRRSVIASQAKGALATASKSTNAAGKGLGTGRDWGWGVAVGVDSMRSIVAIRAAMLINAANAAARRAADAHSPSRKMIRLGKDMADGVRVGLERRTRSTGKAMDKFIHNILATYRRGDARKLVEQVAKGHKVSEKAIKAATKATQRESAALLANARARDRLQKKLDKAVDKLKELKKESKDYAASIKAAIIASGDITSLGRNDDDSTVSTTSLLAELRDKVVAAKRYQDLIAQLTAAGLNQTSLQQLLDAGVETGLATAEAIAAGGQATIAEINDLVKDLTTTGGKLGNAAADTMYGAGIQAAQGLVDGLEKRMDKLEKIGKKLAQALIRAIKKELGIKSPSRVFKALGGNMLDGLEIGLDDTRARTIGRATAAGVLDGFGTPALDMYLSGTAGGAAPIPVSIHLTADVIDQLSRGRAYQRDIEAYRAAGGRTTI